MRSFQRRLFVLWALGALSGCAATKQVRYVYQDHDFGVIGMPENSDRWPTHYRHRAETMMREHFPKGHEIVRAEEVVEGTRTLTVQGTNTAEVLPALSAALIPVGRLGRTSSRSQADKLKVKECRIIYRRSGTSKGPETYTPLATLAPTRYVDPNEAERHRKKDDDENKSEPSLNSIVKDDDTTETGPGQNGPKSARRTATKIDPRPASL